MHQKPTFTQMPAFEGCIKTYIHNALRSWPMGRIACPTRDQIILRVGIVEGYLGSELLLKY